MEPMITQSSKETQDPWCKQRQIKGFLYKTTRRSIYWIDKKTGVLSHLSSSNQNFTFVH